MIAVFCVDDRNGLLFNGRRLSRDRVQQADLLALCGDGPLWIAPFSASLFPESSRVCAAPDFWKRAGAGQVCFFEQPPPAEALERAEAVIVYRWNRTYPADVHLVWEPAGAGFILSQRVEFPGSSHAVITRESYVRGASHGQT